MKKHKIETRKIYGRSLPQNDNVDFENLQFGKIFTDHLFVCKYSNNSWNDGDKHANT